MDKHGVAKLCDFGLVRLPTWKAPNEMVTTTPYTGTISHMAPELFPSQDNRFPVATFAGDIYALGCMVLEVRDSPDVRFFSDERGSVHRTFNPV